MEGCHDTLLKKPPSQVLGSNDPKSQPLDSKQKIHDRHSLPSLSYSPGIAAAGHGKSHWDHIFP